MPIYRKVHFLKGVYYERACITFVLCLLLFCLTGRAKVSEFTDAVQAGDYTEAIIYLQDELSGSTKKLAECEEFLQTYLSTQTAEYQKGTISGTELGDLLTGYEKMNRSNLGFSISLDEAEKIIGYFYKNFDLYPTMAVCDMMLYKK